MPNPKLLLNLATKLAETPIRPAGLAVVQRPQIPAETQAALKLWGNTMYMNYDGLPRGPGDLGAIRKDLAKYLQLSYDKDEEQLFDMADWFGEGASIGRKPRLTRDLYDQLLQSAAAPILDDLTLYKAGTGSLPAQNRWLSTAVDPTAYKHLGPTSKYTLPKGTSVIDTQGFADPNEIIIRSGAIPLNQRHLKPAQYADGGAVNTSKPGSFMPIGRNSAAVHQQRFADGGPVRRPEMEHIRSEGQDASTQPLAGSALKALVRGWLAGTVGLPGDLEGLARAGLHAGASKGSWFDKNVSRDPALPTSEFYKDWLPGKQQGAEMLNNIGSMGGGIGAGTIAKGIYKTGQAAARHGGDLVRRGMEGAGPLSEVLAPVQQLNVIKYYDNPAENAALRTSPEVRAALKMWGGTMYSRYDGLPVGPGNLKAIKQDLADYLKLDPKTDAGQDAAMGLDEWFSEGARRGGSPDTPFTKDLYDELLSAAATPLAEPVTLYKHGDGQVPSKASGRWLSMTTDRTSHQHLGPATKYEIPKGTHVIDPQGLADESEMIIHSDLLPRGVPLIDARKELPHLAPSVLPTRYITPEEYTKLVQKRDGWAHGGTVKSAKPGSRIPFGRNSVATSLQRFADGGPVRRPMEHKTSSGQHAGTQPLTGSALKALVRGWMAGTAGLPGDLEGLARAGLHMGAAPDSWFAKNVSRDPALPTSEFYKEWLPGKQHGDDAIATLGSLFGGVGATKPVSLAKGALSRVAAAAPGPMAGSLAAQRGVVKAPGGQWLSGSVEDALKGLRSQHRTPAVLADDGPMTAEANARYDALNNFIDKQLTRYVQKDMATERDPIRALAERGILHVDPAELNFRPEMHGKFMQEGQTAVAQSLPAKTWEGASDEVLAVNPAGVYQKSVGPGWESNMWLDKTAPDVPVHSIPNRRTASQDLGFDHLMDELRNATNINSGLPAHLRLDPESLARVSVPQAVERVAKINDWRAAQKGAAATVLHKDYPGKGFKWVELRTPPIETAPEGWSVQPSTLKEGFLDIVDPRGQRSFGGATEQAALEKLGVVHGRSALEAALKYEGDTMGHCVGGYCDDVASGKSRIYSLRDAKGQPHTTIEVVPGGNSPAAFENAEGYDAAYDSFVQAKNQGFTGDMAQFIAERYPDKAADIIVQIKGKGNKAPNPEYLPYVQDFVKSGKWSDVGDLGNTGLRRATDAWNPNEEKLIKAAGIKFPTHATQQEIDAINQQVWPGVMGPAKPPGFADGGSVRGLVNAAVGSSNLAKQIGSSADAVRSIAAGNASMSDLNSLRQMASELGYTVPGLSQVMGLAATAKAGYNMATDPTGMNAAKFAAKVNPIAAQALSLYQMATDAKPMDAANFIVGFHPVLRAYNGLADAFGFANIGQLAANLTEIGDPQSPVKLQDLFSNTPMYDANARVLTAPDGILNANSPDFVGPVYAGPSLTGNGTTGEASVSSSGWSFPSYSGGDGINGHSGDSSGNPGGIGG